MDIRTGRLGYALLAYQAFTAWGDDMGRTLVAALTAFAAGLFAAHAQDDDQRPAKGIQDNSFLVEEAYNQEPGVVQSVATLRRQERDWVFTFGQEFPLGSQTHQFSYSVPYAWLRSNGARVQGIGDITLSYRYQALMETAITPAFAPRFGLIVPSGDRDKGTGEGSFGYQINLPVSKIVTDRVTLHGNAGMTSFLDVDGRTPVSFNAGGSVIYAVNRDFNLMLETLAEWTESVTDTREIERDFTFTVSPGVRFAFNPPFGQIVMGIGAPISFSRGQTDYGAIFYLSFENAPPAAK
jgi:Putative MetA-pathway of phenol degradation